MSGSRLAGMVLRLNLPALALALVAMAVATEFALGRLSDAPLFGAIAASIAWIPAGLCLAGAFAMLVALRRYWRWERGAAPTCSHCDGMLGFERNGRYGPYRRCLACGKNEPTRNSV